MPMRSDQENTSTPWRSVLLATKAAHRLKPPLSAPSKAFVTRSEVRARHKQKLWTALQENVSASAEVRLRQHDRSDFRPLMAQLLYKRAVAKNEGRQRKRDDSRKSTVVSDRVFIALQRGGVGRSSLEVEDLMAFASQVHPLKLFSSHVKRSLCEQAQLVAYQHGDAVCAEGESARTFHVILSGSVEAYRAQTHAEASEAASELGRQRSREKAEARRTRHGGRNAKQAPTSLDGALGEPAEDADEGGDEGGDKEEDDGEDGEGVEDGEGGEEDNEHAPSASTSTAPPAGAPATASANAEDADGDDSDDVGGGDGGDGSRGGGGSGGGGGGGPSTDALALPPIPGMVAVGVLREGESFGHAALTTDVTTSVWPSSMRAVGQTICMCVDADMYLEAQRQEEERQDSELDKAVPEGRRGGGGGGGGGGDGGGGGGGAEGEAEAERMRKLRQQSQSLSRLGAALASGGSSLLGRLNVALKTAPSMRTATQLKLISKIMLSTRFFQVGWPPMALLMMMMAVLMMMMMMMAVRIDRAERAPFKKIATDGLHPRRRMPTY